MRIIHQAGATWDKAQADFLKRHGLTVTEGVFSYIEVDPETFARIEAGIMRPDTIHAEGAEFTREELDDAEWVALTGLKQIGYPQPDNDFAYLDEVYDTGRACGECGIAGVQKAPFRIKSDNIREEAFQLGWTFDEIFVRREFYDDLFARLGVGSRPVLIHRTGRESEKIVQLDLKECDRDLDMTGMKFELCPVCGRKKYLRRLLDFLPPLQGAPREQIFHGREYFGSGKSAFKLIYLSQEIRRELLRRKIAKWFQFEPVRQKEKI